MRIINELLLAAEQGKVNVCLIDVINAIHKQKRASRQDLMVCTVQSEAYLHGGVRLAAHLCILFNLFLAHGFALDSFMNCTIVPLVKC